MATVRYTLLAFIVALSALMASTGASYADAAPVVSTWADLGTDNPAFQDATVVPTDDVNPADTPAVVDNPATDNPIDTNANLLMWQAILGFIATFIISAINRFVPGISPDDNMKRAVVAFVICTAIGIVDAVVRDVADLTNILATVLVIFTAAIGFYNAWFRPAGFASKIEGTRRVV